VTKIFLPWIAWAAAASLAAAAAAVVTSSSWVVAAVASSSAAAVVAVVVADAFSVACPWAGWPTQLNYSVGNCLEAGSGTLVVAVAFAAAFQLAVVAEAFAGCCTSPLLIGCTCLGVGSVGIVLLLLLLFRPSSWTAAEVGCIAAVASRSAVAVGKVAAAWSAAVVAAWGAVVDCTAAVDFYHYCRAVASSSCCY